MGGNSESKKTECDNCYKDRFDELSKIVYKMVGSVNTFSKINFAVIAISIVVAAFAYVGTNANAGDIVFSKMTALDNKKIIDEHIEISKDESEETIKWRLSIEKKIDQTNVILEEIVGKIK